VRIEEEEWKSIGCFGLGVATGSLIDRPWHLSGTGGVGGALYGTAGGVLLRSVVTGGRTFGPIRAGVRVAAEIWWTGNTRTRISVGIWGELDF
jgi:hypothetical protein